MKNPSWERDELILALDLYFKHNPSHINKSHKDVIALSNILKSLPIHEEAIDNDSLRNPNGVYMKLMNFLRFDPGYPGVGLARGGKLEEQIWDEFAGNREYLRKVAQTIIDNIGLVGSKGHQIEVNDDEMFPEGKVIYKTHRFLERNSSVTKKAKKHAQQQGRLKCEVCGFDFYRTYGELGEGFIECHHTVPISEYTANQKTNIKDLVLICSNCHRMIHRKRPWLDKESLKDILKDKI